MYQEASPTYAEWTYILQQGEKMARKSLPVTCDPEGRLQRVPLKELQQFQGALKTLYKPAYEKLKSSFQEFGFAFPMFIWHGHNKILDGHQRLHVLTKEGWDVKGGVPVVAVTGETDAEVAKKILIISSQYGKINEQGLYEFTENFSIPLTEFKLPELSDIDMDRFMASFYEDFDLPEDGDIGGYMDDEDLGPAEAQAISQVILYFKQAEYSEIINKMEELIENTDDELIDDPSSLLISLVRKAHEAN